MKTAACFWLLAALVSCTDSSNEPSQPLAEPDAQAGDVLEAGRVDGPDFDSHHQPQESSPDGSADVAVPGMDCCTADGPQDGPHEAADPNGTPVEAHGALHVCDTHLCDAAGAVVQLKGWSFGQLEWYWQDGTVPNAKTVHNIVAQFGATLIRVPVGTFDGIAKSDAQRADSIARARVLLDAAIAEGIYVLLDWHEYKEGDPNVYRDAAVGFFSEMAGLYAQKPNVIYEICNEPNPGNTDHPTVTWKDQIKPYAMAVIPAIRAKAPDSVVVVGTEGWSHKPSIAANDPLTYPNVMYTMHLYTKTDITGDLQDMKAAIGKGAAIFATEWGTTTNDGAQGHDYVKGQQWVDLLNADRISWATWAFSATTTDGQNCDALYSGTSINGPWSDKQITPDGHWKIDRMR